MKQLDYLKNLILSKVERKTFIVQPKQCIEKSVIFHYGRRYLLPIHNRYIYDAFTLEYTRNFYNSLVIATWWDNTQSSAIYFSFQRENILRLEVCGKSYPSTEKYNHSDIDLLGI